MLVVGRWSLVVGRWSLVVGRWLLVVGCRLWFVVVVVVVRTVELHACLCRYARMHAPN